MPSEQVTLAQLVLDGGPFAMRKAGELAEVVLADASGESSDKLLLPGPT